MIARGAISSDEMREGISIKDDVPITRESVHSLTDPAPLCDAAQGIVLSLFLHVAVCFGGDLSEFVRNIC